MIPRIAVTAGDPAGVGPEICLDLLASPPTDCVPIIFGDRDVLEACASYTGKRSPELYISENELKFCTAPAVVDLGRIDRKQFTPGQVSAATGQAAYDYIISAIDHALAGEVDAVTTAPINKEALAAAGIIHPGHTEIFAERMNAERSCMMLTSEELTCSLVTVHVGYDQVPKLLTTEKILDVIELTHAAMKSIRGHEPRLIVCGLNPHAGEGGLFGNREEEEIIQPAIDRARGAGMQITGPLPPDTAFLKTRREASDAHICMYHDQGLIPLKTLAFDEAINITLGLPITRTSVDHGTALDIAWQGTANANSLQQAVKLAARLTS